jgi:hypothetical protein
MATAGNTSQWERTAQLQPLATLLAYNAALPWVVQHYLDAGQPHLALSYAQLAIERGMPEGPALWDQALRAVREASTQGHFEFEEINREVVALVSVLRPCGP